MTVVRADVATVRLPRRPFRVVANPPWAVAESVRAHLLRTPSLVRADLVLPRWLAHRWAARSPLVAVGSSLRAEAFTPPAPTGSAVAVLHGVGPAVTGTVHAVPVEPPCLFVYGTLQPGHLRWPFLEPFAIGHRPADRGRRALRLRLRLAGRRGSPELGDHVVPGTLVDLDPERTDEALAVIDDVEATATDLLGRIAVTTTEGARRGRTTARRPSPAWSASTAGCRPTSGEWRTRELPQPTKAVISAIVCSACSSCGTWPAPSMISMRESAMRAAKSSA